MAGIGEEIQDRLRRWTLELGGPGTRERLEKLTPPRNEFGVDPYGFDVDYLQAAAAPVLWLYRKYFRVKAFGLEHVPGEGPALLVGNHSGQLPFDAAMVEAACLVDKDPPRAVRALVDKWVPTLPFVSTIFARCGQIVGTPENCRRLLSAGEVLMVFPEGTRGLNKPFGQRYQLQRFPLGFMRLALENDVPVIPVGVVGAEEQAPAILDLQPLARLFSFPHFPVTLTGLPLPMPVRYRIWFGEPMRFTGRADDEDAVLEGKVARVRDAVAGLLARGLAEREHVFW